MWKSRLAGRTLHFHLFGINNQNFIMRDEETGSWWQQITGCAFQGPLAPQCLDPIIWDEVTFAVFKRDHPGAQVLLPAEEFKEDYATPDWETEIAEYPTVTPIDPHDTLKPRDLVVGVTSGTEARAYPWATLAGPHAIVDTVESTPLLVFLNPDGRSLRCFDRRVAGRTLEGFSRTRTCPPVLHDGTGSEWDFTGRAITGPLAGERLARIICLKDYWFDWKLYHPATSVFSPEQAADRVTRPLQPAPQIQGTQ